MMLHLSRDTGASFTLLQWIELNDLAALNATCTTWRKWLLPASGCKTRSRALVPSRFAQLHQCPWVRSKLHRIDLLPEPNAASRPSDLMQATYESCLLALHDFPMLRGLVLHVQVATVQESVISHCFDALAGIVALQVHLPTDGVASGCDAVVRLIFKHAARLRDLLKLTVHGRVHAPQTLPLEALPLIAGRLCGLCHFSLEARYNSFRATPEQARCLAACAHLRTLEFGLWDADPALLNADPPIDEETFLTDRIGALVEGIVRHPRKSSVDNFSRLIVMGSVMSSAMWTHFRRLSTLTSVWPTAFRQLSAEQWNQLRCFTALENLRIHAADLAADGRSLLPVADFLPSMIQCTTVSNLALGGGLSLSTAQLELICLSLPALRWLAFRVMYLDGLAPLSLAPKLCDLTFVHCQQVNGDPLLVRVILPPLASLTKLTLADLDEYLLSAEEAAPLNAAVLQRCPLLTLEQFPQHLLPAAGAADANHA